MPFRDRTEAGKMLAGKAGMHALGSPLVVSLPGGAVQVAVEIAKELGVSIEVVPVIELSTPGNPEYVVGAIAENSSVFVDHDALTGLGLREDSLASRAALATAEVVRLAKIYRGDGMPLSVAQRTVVVVDDGAATAPALSAVAAAMHERGATRIVLATPAPPAAPLNGYDKVIRTDLHEALADVGVWYMDGSAPDHTQAAAIAEHHNGRVSAGHEPA